MRLPDYFDFGGQKLAGSWRLVIGRQESAVEDKSCSIPGAGTLASWPMLNYLRQARRKAIGEHHPQIKPLFMHVRFH